MVDSCWDLFIRSVSPLKSEGSHGDEVILSGACGGGSTGCIYGSPVNGPRCGISPDGWDGLTEAGAVAGCSSLRKSADEIVLLPAVDAGRLEDAAAGLALIGVVTLCGKLLIIDSPVRTRRGPLL